MNTPHSDTLVETQRRAFAEVLCCILNGLAVESEAQSEWFEAMVNDLDSERLRNATAHLCQHIQHDIWEKYGKPLQGG